MAVATTNEQLSKTQMLDMLRMMMLIREFEDRTAEWYARGRIAGFVHLYNGQEAAAVGVISALRPEDILMSHYRDHGHAIAKGADPNAAMAELFGREGGLVHGKGGSMHFFSRQANFWGGYAIVAGHLPLAVGVGFALKQQGTDRIVCCIMGDAATPNGYFHESLNIAKLWNVPILFVVENNGYGMGTAVEVHSAVPVMAQKACAYDIPSERCDGMDVLAVRDAAVRAVEYVRSGQGPFLLEVVTYRYRGHSMADPVRYREKEEEESWRIKDPITHFRDRLVQEGVLTEQEAQQVAENVKQEMDAAIKFAEASPPPPPEALWTNIYADPVDGPGAAILQHKK